MDNWAGLIGFDDFKNSIQKNKTLLNNLSKFRLEELNETGKEGIKEELAKLFDGLDVIKETNAKTCKKDRNIKEKFILFKEKNQTGKEN